MAFLTTGKHEIKLEVLDDSTIVGHIVLNSFENKPRFIISDEQKQRNFSKDELETICNLLEKMKVGNK